MERDPKIELARDKDKSRGSDQIQAKESLQLKLVYESTTEETNLQFQWHQNGLVLPGAVDAVLSISSAADHHTGTYRCHVSHAHTPWEDHVAVADDDHHDDLVIRSHPIRIEINVPSNYKLSVYHTVEIALLSRSAFVYPAKNSGQR